MEKDTGHYHYEPYPPLVAKQNNNPTTNANKKQETKEEATSSSCKCFGRKSKRKAFFTSLVTNLGICILLFGYTLIGSVLFLTIEGGSSVQQQVLATTSQIGLRRNRTRSVEAKIRAEEARARTVETIWDITVSLNILYRDNWTRLAAQEITKFQDELMQTMQQDMAKNNYAVTQARVVGGQGMEIQWTFAKAFLYSLTVLTTIGKWNLII